MHAGQCVQLDRPHCGPQHAGGWAAEGAVDCPLECAPLPPIPHTQRVAYGVTTFVAKPPYHAPPPPPPLPGADPVSAVLAPMGIVAAALGMLFACYVAYKHGLASKVAAAARAHALAQSHPGLSAFTEVAANRPPSVFVPASKETVDEHPLSKPRRAPSLVRSESAAEASELAARLLMRAGADAALYSSSSSAAVAKPPAAAAALLAADTYAPPPQASRSVQADTATCVSSLMLSLADLPTPSVAGRLGGAVACEGCRGSHSPRLRDPRPCCQQQQRQQLGRQQQPRPHARPGVIYVSRVRSAHPGTSSGSTGPLCGCVRVGHRPSSRPGGSSSDGGGCLGSDWIGGSCAWRVRLRAPCSLAAPRYACGGGAHAPGGGAHTGCGAAARDL